MYRYDVINWFIKRFGYKSYLEIGIYNPNFCFNKIACRDKTGVDPNKNTTFRLTSDNFFAANRKIFDIIFIDGLHVYPQVIRDVDNGLGTLSENGTILLHDCRPLSEETAREERVLHKPWHGTVWKAFAHLRATRDDICMKTIDCDCGIGVIRKGTQSRYLGPYETWGDYINNANEINNLIPFKELEKWY